VKWRYPARTLRSADSSQSQATPESMLNSARALISSKPVCWQASHDGTSARNCFRYETREV